MENLQLEQKVQLKVKYRSYPDDNLEAFRTKGTLRECLAEVADSDYFYISGDEIREGHLDDEEEELTLEDILNRLDDCDGAAFIIDLSVRVGNGKYENLISNDDYYDIGGYNGTWY